MTRLATLYFPGAAPGSVNVTNISLVGPADYATKRGLSWRSIALVGR